MLSVTNNTIMLNVVMLSVVMLSVMAPRICHCQSLPPRVTRLGNFCQLGYFWKLIMIFFKDEFAQRYGDTLGYFLAKQIYKCLPN
jgi:hypothetical protein